MTNKEWTFEMEIVGRYVVTVVADNAEEAEEKATNEFYSADFGEAFDVEMSIVSADYDIVDSDI